MLKHLPRAVHHQLSLSHREGSARGTRQAQLHGLALSRSGRGGSQHPTASRTAQLQGHSSTNAAQYCREVCCWPQSICPSQYALDSMKVAPSFDYEVGQFYGQRESRCPVLWEGCCPCYTHTGKHRWEGRLSRSPFPDFSKLNY